MYFSFSIAQYYVHLPFICSPTYELPHRGRYTCSITIAATIITITTTTTTTTTDSMPTFAFANESRIQMYTLLKKKPILGTLPDVSLEAQTQQRTRPSLGLLRAKSRDAYCGAASVAEQRHWRAITDAHVLCRRSRICWKTLLVQSAIASVLELDNYRPKQPSSQAGE